jgi:hypothetical protein
VSQADGGGNWVSRRENPLLARPRDLVYCRRMKKLLLMLLVIAAVLAGLTGCKSAPGSREYTPGKGWQEN